MNWSTEDVEDDDGPTEETYRGYDDGDEEAAVVMSSPPPPVDYDEPKPDRIMESGRLKNSGSSNGRQEYNNSNYPSNNRDEEEGRIHHHHSSTSGHHRRSSSKKKTKKKKKKKSSSSSTKPRTTAAAAEETELTTTTHSRTLSSPATTVESDVVLPPHTSSSKRKSSSSRRQDQQEERHSSTNANASTTNTTTPPMTYSITELVKTLGHGKDTSQLTPELERRVLDFRLAQLKRREKYGQQNRCGIFGMYAHLSDVRIDLEWSEDAAWRRNNGMPYLSWTDFDAVRTKPTGMAINDRPWFTYFIVFICTIMLLVEFGFNDWKVEPLTINPLIGPSGEAMVRAGARETRLIVEGGQWFRIFSPLFLHAGIIHYVINMLALWFIGGAIERTHGIVSAMVLFFVPGVGGNILSAIFLPQYISVGASGGIFGLVGGCIADISLNWNLLFIQSGEDDTQTKRRNIGAIAWLVVDIVVNMLIGLTPYVDNFSHMGGLFYGFCCGLSAIEPLPVGFFGVYSGPWEKVRAVVVRFLGLILSVILIIVTTVILATMDMNQSFCRNCRYVSCVPFPPGKDNKKWWYCDDCDQVSATVYKKNGGSGSDNDEYDLIEMTCPNGDIEEIVPAMDTKSNNTDIEIIRRQLPSYCREYCSESMA